jgi:hypothetical protein
MHERFAGIASAWDVVIETAGVPARESEINAGTKATVNAAIDWLGLPWICRPVLGHIMYLNIVL